MTPGDGQWGAVLEDGTVTGMVGMVARHEAHMAITAITATGRQIVCINSHQKIIMFFTF